MEGVNMFSYHAICFSHLYHKPSTIQECKFRFICVIKNVQFLGEFFKDYYYQKFKKYFKMQRDFEHLFFKYWAALFITTPSNILVILRFCNGCQYIFFLKLAFLSKAQLKNFSLQLL